MAFDAAQTFPVIEDVGGVLTAKTVSKTLVAANGQCYRLEDADETFSISYVNHVVFDD